MYGGYLSNAGQDISSLSSEPSLLPVYRHKAWEKKSLRKLTVHPVYVCACLHLPSEMPLDRVELSACTLVGLWLSITLSSNRWREPALGNVALLNSTVFILWMKLQRNREIFIDFPLKPVKKVCSLLCPLTREKQTLTYIPGCDTSCVHRATGSWETGVCLGLLQQPLYPYAHREEMLMLPDLEDRLEGQYIFTKHEYYKQYSFNGAFIASLEDTFKLTHKILFWGVCSRCAGAWLNLLGQPKKLVMEKCNSLE